MVGRRIKKMSSICHEVDARQEENAKFPELTQEVATCPAIKLSPPRMLYSVIRVNRT